MADQQPEGCQQERGECHRYAVAHEATKSQPVACLGQQTDSDKVGRGAQESGIAPQVSASAALLGPLRPRLAAEWRRR